MGDAFGKGLIKTSGLGKVLNLSQGKLGGDRATVISVVGQLMRGLTSLDLSANKINVHEVKELAGAILANASVTSVSVTGIGFLVGMLVGVSSWDPC